MKYLVIVTIFSISSCALFNSYSWEGLSEIKTVENATDYLDHYIRYVLDGADYMQFPKETYERGTGDCEDQSGLLAHLFVYNLHLEDVQLVICWDKTNSGYHMLVKAEDVYYDPAFNEYNIKYYDKYYTIKYLSLEQYMSIARLYHL